MIYTDSSNFFDGCLFYSADYDDEIYMSVLFIYFYCSFSIPFFCIYSASGKKFVVVIDAGHGGKDPGAIGRIIREKNINLGIALKLGALIRENHPDVKVVYTRDRDIFVELQQRANIANRVKADLFISIHTNSATNRSAYGTETYTLGLARTEENLRVAKRENSVILLEDDFSKRYEGFDPNSTESYIMFEFLQDKHLEQSINLASSIQRQFKNSAKRVDRGVSQAGFLVLRNTGMPSVLIEVGYISNRNEEAYLASEKGQLQMAKSIYNAFCDYKSDCDRKQGAVVSRNSAKEKTDSSLQSENRTIVVTKQIRKRVRHLPVAKLYIKYRSWFHLKSTEKRIPALKVFLLCHIIGKTDYINILMGKQPIGKNCYKNYQEFGNYLKTLLLFLLRMV